MRYLILLVFLPPMLLGTVGYWFTSHKLHKMRQIRGWEPGGVVSTHRVTAKWVGGSAYWLSWDPSGALPDRSRKLNLSKPVWDRYPVGSAIEIVRLPGDRSPYHRDGIYASDGNFQFDRVLLGIEGGLAGVSLLGCGLTALLMMLRGRRRRSERT